MHSKTLRGDIELIVADTGVGIHPSAMTKVFQPFFQIDHSSTRAKGGTGLGLPISKHLAELHGGDLRIDSTPGIGTTVTVTLPAARAINGDSEDEPQHHRDRQHTL